VPSLSPAELASALALVGVVILIAALLSGLVERSGVPQVAIFLALGAVLGPAGLALLEVGLDSPPLQIAATLSLTLILFTDALTLDLREARQHGALALLAVGPGTLLSAALFAGAAWWLLDLSAPASAILGAALASTDPVLLKGLLRHPELPAGARHALRLESGLNDVVLLPIVLVSLAILGSGAVAGSESRRLALDLLILGPGAGVLVGLLSLATLDLVRSRLGVRRDYESLYSLGVAFAAYAAAESVHGSGFLAAFAAGLTIALLDVELCDCFQEYGETTAELLLLLTFVLLGSSLIWSGVGAASGATIAFATFVLFARPALYLAVLAPTRIDWRTRLLVAWFGPRGLSSLLLALLAVFAGAPESGAIFQVASFVVLLSILLHGGTLIWIGRRGQIGTPPELITIDEVRALIDGGERVIPVDARKVASWEASDEQARGALRLLPDRATADARVLGLPSDAWLVLYCT
jgi:sodium/hydrogen antiporter